MINYTNVSQYIVTSNIKTDLLCLSELSFVLSLCMHVLKTTSVNYNLIACVLKTNLGMKVIICKHKSRYLQ